MSLLLVRCGTIVTIGLRSVRFEGETLAARGVGFHHVAVANDERLARHR